MKITFLTVAAAFVIILAVVFQTGCTEEIQPLSDDEIETVMGDKR